MQEQISLHNTLSKQVYTAWLEMQLLPRYKTQYNYHAVQDIVWHCIFYLYNTIRNKILDVNNIDIIFKYRKHFYFVLTSSRIYPQKIKSPDFGIQCS
jgi:hypothetical protein